MQKASQENQPQQRRQYLVPNLGDYVRFTLDTRMFPAIRKSLIYEGVVSSTLFDKNFEISYTDATDQPVSHWFSVDEISNLEIL